MTLSRIEQIKHGFSKHSLTDKIVIAVSFLSFLAVVPMLVARLVEQNIAMVILDSILLIAFFGICVSTYFHKHSEIAKYTLGTILTIGMAGTCIFGTSANMYWLYPGFTAIFFMFSPSVALMLCAGTSMIVLPFLLQRLPTTDIVTLYATLSTSIVFVFYFAREFRSAHERLTLLASEDFLTQTGNRRAFQSRAELCIEQLKRKGKPSVLVLFDMDFFKLLNDEHGHVVGDAVLQDVTNIVQSCLRVSDKLYRLGGEEFAIILHNASAEDAMGVAEKIRESIAVRRDRELPCYTVSFGIASLKAGESLTNWMSRTDNALYESKRNGRDQVSIA
uniref:GGDEF domain-containing protein n=1 Tax=Ningiella ruwaisensis TaxID=2364274 RepID=UPI00109F9F65|nr:GGDEF domain-containing protein [Ningiella ruwaisensis]